MRIRTLLENNTEIKFIDLGLPSGLKWATGNLVKNDNGIYSIGKETEWGTYVSWGNIDGHNEGEGYIFDDTNYNSTPGQQLGYSNISSTDAQHDICFARLGSPWHLPSRTNFQELINYTDNEWIRNHNNTGVNGRKFMKKTDHSIYIFLPASGNYDGTILGARNNDLCYWSSNYYSYTQAYRLFSFSTQLRVEGYYRRLGYTIRPVQ